MCLIIYVNMHITKHPFTNIKYQKKNNVIFVSVWNAQSVVRRTRLRKPNGKTMRNMRKLADYLFVSICLF